MGDDVVQLAGDPRPLGRERPLGRRLGLGGGARSRAVESASRRRSTRMPRPATAAGRIAKTAVSRPGNRGSSLPSVPATAMTVTTATTAIARFRYLECVIAL